MAALIVKSAATLAVLAAVGALVPTARADFMYQTSVSYSDVPGLGLSITPVSGSVLNDGPANISIADISFAPTASGNASQLVTFTEVLSGTPGTETVTLSGILSYWYQPGFVAPHFSPTAESTVGSGYTVPLAFANCMPTNLSGTEAGQSLAVMPNGTAAATPLPHAAGGCLVVLAAGAAVRRRSVPCPVGSPGSV